MTSLSNQQHLLQPSVPATTAGCASETKQVWHAPQLISYGEVVEMTQGISYNPLDGISNLTV